MTDLFGDYEPEDAWHPLDTRPELVRNLFARIALLDGLANYPVRRLDPITEITNRLEAWRQSDRPRSDRDLERARQLAEDLDYMGGRGG